MEIEINYREFTWKCRLLAVGFCSRPTGTTVLTGTRSTTDYRIASLVSTIVTNFFTVNSYTLTDYVVIQNVGKHQSQNMRFPSLYLAMIRWNDVI